MRVLDLFSGIGGFSIGLERAGMQTVAFCETNPFCRQVLAKRWPGVRIYHTIKRLKRQPAVDVVCGGFPCQDISVAGKGVGLAGARSGLWSEFARIIGVARPRYAIVENVSALLSRGLGTVLGDLAALGYDAEWHCIPASAVGAPHRRDRIWIIAYPKRDELWDESGRSRGAHGPNPAESSNDGATQPLADSDGQRKPQSRRPIVEIWRWLGDGGAPMGDADGTGLAQREEDQYRQALNSSASAKRTGRKISNADGEPPERAPKPWEEHCGWEFEPDVGRVAYGIPARVDRLKALGNAVVPKIPEIIGRAIMNADKSRGSQNG